ncbi:MAG: hypothetical protein EAZ57_10385 [Cytophagales bacterium]|nr:MAG: hypothetical protein EAZ67_06995 [Cytophagales bacterium]TAF59646.1 MAG: hypothetical protein EAZ57_10385 [Cytophagales bacterium]
MKRLFILLTFCLWACAVQAGEISLSGLYTGSSNLFIQCNGAGIKENCITSIEVNSKKVAFPKSLAFEINLKTTVKVNEQVTVKIIYGAGCTPKIINPQIIKSQEEFGFVSVTASAEGLSWTAKGEKRYSQYIVQVFKGGSWSDEQAVACKGVGGNQTYTSKLTHSAGNNKYRVKYIESGGKTMLSSEAAFTAQSSEITFYPQRVTAKITFSQKVKFKITDTANKTLKEGDALTIDCSDLPMGVYTLEFAGKKEKFFKK